MRFLLEQMDRFGIEKGMLGVSFAEDRSADSLRAVREYPDRFFGSLEVDPNRALALYGRGLAKIKMGRTMEGRADQAAARVLDPSVEQQFSIYGVN